MHKILVVDDDINILNMMKNFLTDLVGVEYVLTDSPFEALKIFQTESIDMLITDVAMPEMFGNELADACNAIRKVPTILISGCCLPQSKYMMVPKPFTAKGLQDVIRIMLKGGDASHICTCGHSI